MNEKDYYNAAYDNDRLKTAIIHTPGSDTDVLGEILTYFDKDTIIEATARAISTPDNLHKLICEILNKPYFDKDTPKAFKQKINQNTYQINY